MTKNMMVSQLIAKAAKSKCKHKVSAIAFDKKGNFIARSNNISRFNRYGGSLHAEMRLMRKYGKNIKTIVICRTNKSGNLLAIHPCNDCKEKAEKLNIKITTICG